MHGFDADYRSKTDQELYKTVNNNDPKTDFYRRASQELLRREGNRSRRLTKLSLFIAITSALFSGGTLYDRLANSEPETPAAESSDVEKNDRGNLPSDTSEHETDSPARSPEHSP